MSLLLIQENFETIQEKWHILYMLFQSPMAIENCESVAPPRNLWLNKLTSIHIMIMYRQSVPPNVSSACGPDFRGLSEDERRGRSSIRLTNQSTQRLFKWIEKATRSQTLGCFLLHNSLPSPAFKWMPVSLQTKIIRALRSFKQSKIWSLCGCCINKWMALPTLKKSNIRCAWGS